MPLLLAVLVAVHLRRKQQRVIEADGKRYERLRCGACWCASHEIGRVCSPKDIGKVGRDGRSYSRALLRVSCRAMAAHNRRSLSAQALHTLARDDGHHDERRRGIGPPPSQQRVRAAIPTEGWPRGRRKSPPAASRHCSASLPQLLRDSTLGTRQQRHHDDCRACDHNSGKAALRLCSAATARERTRSQRRRRAAESRYRRDDARCARGAPASWSAARSRHSRIPADSVSITESSPKPTSAMLPASRPGNQRYRCFEAVPRRLSGIPGGGLANQGCTFRRRVDLSGLGNR